MVFIRHRLCLYRESYFTVQVERLVHNLVLCFILKPLRHTPTFFQGKEKIKKKERKGKTGRGEKRAKAIQEVRQKWERWKWESGGRRMTKR